MAMETSNKIESIDSLCYENNTSGNSINLIEKIASQKDEQELVINKLTIKQLID